MCQDSITRLFVVVALGFFCLLFCVQLKAYFAELHGICSYRANRSQFVFVLFNLMAKEGAIKGIILVSIFDCTCWHARENRCRGLGGLAVDQVRRLWPLSAIMNHLTGPRGKQTRVRDEPHLKAFILIA